MLNRIIDAAAHLARRKLRRGSGSWRMLARTWYAWRTFWAACRNNRWMQHRWARNEAEFDRLIREISTRTDDFFVVQIGACDGLLADPIHRWIQSFKWRGILVEPQRVEFEKLTNTYKQDQDRLVFENVAICDRDGTCTLYRMKDDARSEEWERGFASLLPRFASDRFIADTVPCITFDTLLHRHQVTRVDLLQIDTEGYDFEILKLVDLNKVRPVLIRYEHRHLMPGDKHACRRYLERHGYTILEMEFDSGCVRQEAG